MHNNSISFSKFIVYSLINTLRYGLLINLLLISLVLLTGFAGFDTQGALAVSLSGQN